MLCIHPFSSFLVLGLFQLPFLGLFSPFACFNFTKQLFSLFYLLPPLGKTDLVFDVGPDDAGHLIAVQVDDGILHLDLLEASGSGHHSSY